jgi:hypothetical protein
MFRHRILAHTCYLGKITFLLITTQLTLIFNSIIPLSIRLNRHYHLRLHQHLFEFPFSRLYLNLRDKVVSKAFEKLMRIAEGHVGLHVRLELRNLFGYVFSRVNSVAEVFCALVCNKVLVQSAHFVQDWRESLG